MSELKDSIFSHGSVYGTKLQSDDQLFHHSTCDHFYNFIWLIKEKKHVV